MLSLEDYRLFIIQSLSLFYKARNLSCIKHRVLEDMFYICGQ